MASVCGCAPSDPISLLLATSNTIREIASIQRSHSKDAELKSFYAFLTTYCLLINEHTKRISQAANGIDKELLFCILAQLEAVTTPFVQTEPAESHLTIWPGLGSLNQRWDKMRNKPDADKIDSIRRCLHFGADSAQRSKLTDDLEKWEEAVRRTYPEDTSQWPEDETPQKKTREPSYAVWNAAQSIWKALIACKSCSCSPQHEFSARLGLGTHRKPDMRDVLDEEFDFNIFLSIQEEWQEARFHAAKEKAVQFAEDAESPIAKRKKTQKIKAMLVKQLCDPMVKVRLLQQKDKSAKRLEFKVTRGRLYKLQSELSNSKIDRNKEPISLDEVLRGGTRSFTERTRRILAVLLSYAVLHLYDTPWLQPSWSSSNIVFFRTVDSEIPLQPFLQTKLSNLDISDLYKVKDQIMSGTTTIHPDDLDPDDIDPDDIDPDDIDPDDLLRHHCPSLVTLAMMLMEVCFPTPFDLLATRYHLSLGQDSSNNGRYTIAKRVFERCQAEIPDYFQFKKAVKQCLDPTAWEDDAGNKLNSESLRTKIYQEIVRPLENDLSQAFSSVSLDDLDSCSQTLDFGSGDQTILNQQAHTQILNETEAMLRATSPPIRSVSPHNIGTPQPMAPLNLNMWAPYTMQVATALPSLPPIPRHIGYHPLRHTLQLANGDSGYNKALRFFDDEACAEGYSMEMIEAYRRWKKQYEHVYSKFIPNCLVKSVKRPKIAVLDTGIDKDHPDFEAREDHISECFNWVNESRKQRVPDRNGHGTFTAGLILDYAPDAELFIAKIADNQPSTANLVAKAIMHAVNHWKVDIISMSFGFPDRSTQDYAALENAIKHAYSKDVLMFAAASNSGGRLGRAYPAREQNVICIHSTNTNGSRSDFSPTPEKYDINLATVGEAVESAWPVALCDESTNPECIAHKSGTSYATPIVAAIAGFLLLYVRLHLPEYSNRIKQQAHMKKVLQVIAKKGQDYQPRDGYHFVDLSLFKDSLFGNQKSDIDCTLRGLLG